MLRDGLIRRYREFLPVEDNACIVTLNEGDTPLIQANRLAEEIHPRINLYLKYEGLNPTGSFKDRGMTMAVTQAMSEGHRAVICASTGNTSASAAAYAARAGMQCVVLIPEGKIAMGKLAQALIEGCRVIQIRGNFDRALELVREIADEHPIALVNSVNPYRIQGQKTGAFEIVDDFEGYAPDLHVLPVGNAGNITAYWMGYKEYHQKGLSKNLPRMAGFQAEGAAPIVLGHPVEAPETFATAIRIGNPATWEGAIAARDESHGLIDSVTDDEIREAYKRIATAEGIFCEPASAAGIAGLFKLSAAGYFDSFEPVIGDRVRVTAVLTGHGLKDTQTALASAENEPLTIDAESEAIVDAIGLYEEAAAT